MAFDRWTAGLNWWATRRWKFGVDDGHISLDRGGVTGVTHAMRTRFQWIYQLACVELEEHFMPRHSVASRRLLAVTLVGVLAAGLEAAHAQDPAPAKAKEEPKRGWSDTADLSLVVTKGNTDSTSVGFTNKLRYRWERAKFEFDVSAVRANTADDRFFRVDPGLEFPVGGAPSHPPTTLIQPSPTLDVANYLVRGAYERRLSPRVFWNTGASWYRNDDAGILNRYVLHAGVGNAWVDRERRRFATSYGISYTDREEEEPDPEKDRRFGGARFGWTYMERFNASTTLDSELAMNVNLSDGRDSSLTTINAVTVTMSERLSLRVSLQWLFENEPALETDLDVVAFVQVLNPDGIPGSGDERFRTVESGGTKLVIGTSDARKDRLDTVVLTALVLKF